MTTVRVRDPESYPASLKYVLGIVSINEMYNIVGSAKYLGVKYAGDTDVFESVNMNTDRDNALEQYASLVSTIAFKILILEGKIILNDFKAGEDKRFKISNRSAVKAPVVTLFSR